MMAEVRQTAGRWQTVQDQSMAEEIIQSDGVWTLNNLL